MNRIVRLVIRNVMATMPVSILVSTLLLPILIFLVMGFSYTELIPPFIISGKEISYIAFLAAGVIAMTAVESSMASGSSFWIDRAYGLMDQILVGPFTKTDYLLSKVITSMLIGLASAGVIALMTVPVLPSISMAGFLIVLAAVVVGSLLFGIFAIILSSYVKSEGSFNAIINLLFIILMFTSSTFYPLDLVPETFRIIFLANPLTYVADIIRFGLFKASTATLLLEGTILVSELIVLLLALRLKFK